jgi:cytidine deaminase
MNYIIIFSFERMNNMTFDELYKIAKNTLNPRKISAKSYAGFVAAATCS